MPKRSPDIRKLARRQRGVLWLILAGLTIYGLQFLLAPYIVGTDLDMVVFGILTVAHLALSIGVSVFVALVLHAMGVHLVWIVLLTLLSFAPCANLLILVFMNAAATRRLRSAGLRVRFMGVDPEELERVLNPNLCKTCGYDLTGNISGVCPECGTPLPPQARPLDQTAQVLDFNALARTPTTS